MTWGPLFFQAQTLIKERQRGDAAEEAAGGLRAEAEAARRVVEARDKSISELKEAYRKQAEEGEVLRAKVGELEGVLGERGRAAEEEGRARREEREEAGRKLAQEMEEAQRKQAEFETAQALYADEISQLTAQVWSPECLILGSVLSLLLDSTARAVKRG